MLLFQPTLPARGATRRSRTTESSSIISTHAPRTGSDTIQILQITLPVAFQPTLPARGATRWLCALLGTAADFNPRSPHGERPWRCWLRQPTPGISTHAPRTGSDGESVPASAQPRHFNPRSPHGERLVSRIASSAFSRFQPTLPARGATHRYVMVSQGVEFQPTLPARGATSRDGSPVLTKGISTHAPRTGSDHE